MAWFPLSQTIGFQPIDEASTTLRHPLGEEVQARHTDYGVGTFKYLKGAATVYAGTWVTYSSDDHSVTLLAGNAKGPVAVAMAEVGASSYGWYQIGGKTLGQAASDACDNADVYVKGDCAGMVDDGVVTGDRVQRAKFASAGDCQATGTEFELDRPFVDDGTGGGTS